MSYYEEKAVKLCEGSSGGALPSLGAVWLYNPLRSCGAQVSPVCP